MKRAKQAPEIIHFRVKAKALCKALVTVLKNHKEALKKNILLTFKFIYFKNIPSPCSVYFFWKLVLNLTILGNSSSYKRLCSAFFSGNFSLGVGGGGERGLKVHLILATSFS